MSLEETLMELEEGFWRAAGNGAFYREHMADDGLLVLPEPYGIIDKEGAIAAVDAAEPWASFEIQEPRFLQLSEDSALLSYRATGEREGQPGFSAYASTVYVNRGGRWMLALHQQSF